MWVDRNVAAQSANQFFGPGHQLLHIHAVQVFVGLENGSNGGAAAVIVLDEGVILREQGAKLAEEGIGAGIGGRGWGRADGAFWMHFSAIFPEKYRTRTEFEERLVAETLQEEESCGGRKWGVMVAKHGFVILIVFKEGRKARANNFRVPHIYEILSLVSE